MYKKKLNTYNKNGDIMSINFVEIFSVILRAILSLITLFLVTKMLGKKQVSQLSLFDYVIGISIGNFAAEMTINLETNEINGTIAVLVFGFFAYLVSYLSLKSIMLRRFFMGTPTIIIKDGKIIENNMKKMRLDINDLLEELRCKGYFDISQVECAIMEVNGEISILPKSNYRSLTPNDIDRQVPKESICANVIIDGKVMKENLKNINKSRRWLKNELKKQKYSDLSKILLATVDINETLNIYEKSEITKFNDALE